MRQVLLVGAALLTTLGSVVSLQDFTFYALTLQWPPSACDPVPPGQHCIDHIPERFTIHGLWPQRKDASPLHPRDAECNDNHFSTKNIENILKKKSFYTNLKEDWPNLYGQGQGQGADVGIEVGKSYTLEEIEQKLKGKYGANPQIACNKKNQVWEIRFCYKRVEGREPVDLEDCPKLSDRKYPCDKNKVHLPPAPAPALREVHSEL
ncbi:hypothetical protein V6N11_070156 [Hibiscus sabdariffa]|uniref:Uncharacterized protein n=1 Tax=Hibiscus sabdariffa TaxID=183260 RepID=A0ABR2QE68_9ROSI